MKVFLSWSGEKSRAVAKALREWLPYINTEIEPWMSAADIDPGKRWSGEIAKELQDTSFGIVCVTRDNQSSPWLNFEAGALAKQVDESRVVPLTIDLKPSDVMQPLGGFQGKEMTKDGLLEVLRSLNDLCSHRVPDVAEACDRNWSALETKLEGASTSTETTPVRDDRDLLEEILQTVRGLQSNLGDAFDPMRLWPRITGPNMLEERARMKAAVDSLAELLPIPASIIHNPDPLTQQFIIETENELHDDLQGRVIERARSLGTSVVFVFRD